MTVSKAKFETMVADHMRRMLIRFRGMSIDHATLNQMEALTATWLEANRSAGALPLDHRIVITYRRDTYAHDVESRIDGLDCLD